MAQIETYSSRGQIQAQNSTADNFSIAGGLADLSRATGKMSDQLYQIKQEELQLEAAATMAEGQQKWMIELDQRKQAVEEGRMSHQGFADNFQKDYNKWAAETSSKFYDGKFKKSFELDLLRMQNSMLDGVISYEASKRAQKIKENYDRVTAPISAALRMAESPDQVTSAIKSAEAIMPMLPPLVQKEFSMRLETEGAQSYMRLSDDPAEIDAIVSSMSPENMDNVADFAMSNKNRIRAQLSSKVNGTISDATRLAQDGLLNPGWSAQLDADIGKFLPEDQEKIIQSIAKIEDTNKLSSSIWTMDDATFSRKQEDLANISAATKDPEERAQIEAQRRMMFSIRENMSKLLTEDFSGIAQMKDPAVKDAYNQYIDTTNSTMFDDYMKDLMIKTTFNNYIGMVDGYRESIGWTGNVYYLPQDTAQSISNEMTQALTKADGVDTFISKIDSYRNLYGDKFGTVLRQISKDDPALGALTIIPNIEANPSIRKSPQVKKKDLITALNLLKTDPDRFKNFDKTLLVNSDQSELSTTLNSVGMFEEDKNRRYAYEALTKFYSSVGDSDAAENAYDVAYGDIGIYNQIVYPASLKPAIRNIVSGAEMRINNEQDITFPLGTKVFEGKELKANMADYVYFKTNQEGNGVQAYWIETGEPVLRGNKQPVSYTWTEAELEGVKVQSKDKSWYKGLF